MQCATLFDKKGLISPPLRMNGTVIPWRCYAISFPICLELIAHLIIKLPVIPPDNFRTILDYATDPYRKRKIAVRRKGFSILSASNISSGICQVIEENASPVFIDAAEVVDTAKVHSWVGYRLRIEIRWKKNRRSVINVCEGTYGLPCYHFQFQGFIFDAFILAEVKLIGLLFFWTHYARNRAFFTLRVISSTMTSILPRTCSSYLYYLRLSYCENCSIDILPFLNLYLHGIAM